MGRLSDKRYSARRFGKRERARVKRHRRSEYWLHVGGVGSAYVKAGRKKHWNVVAYVNRALDAARLSGESLTSKSVISIERPLYKIEIGPTSGDI